MKGRGLLTPLAVGLVLVVGALALADTLRNYRSSEPRPTPTIAEEPTTSTSTSTTPFRAGPRPEAPEGWQVGTLRGVLTFVDANTCAIRAVGLAGGRERPTPEFETACGGFWAPPVGARVAFIQPFEDGGILEFADLNRGRNEIATFIAGGDVHWSLDAQRAAWCYSDHEGLEIEWLGASGRLEFCPVAYTPEGELARAEGGRLVLDGRPVAEIPGRIRYAQFGTGGEIAIVDARGRIYRFGSEADTVADPVAGWSRRPPIFSPDLCRAAVLRQDVPGLPREPEGRLDVVDLGCEGPVTYRSYPGSAAAWSPDGEWLAIGTPGEIQFYPAEADPAEPPPLTWPAQALSLAWRP